MLIKPSDIHENIDTARAAVLATGDALGVECNCVMTSQWMVKINGNERTTFLELAREEARNYDH